MIRYVCGPRTEGTDLLKASNCEERVLQCLWSGLIEYITLKSGAIVACRFLRGEEFVKSSVEKIVEHLRKEWHLVARVAKDRRPVGDTVMKICRQSDGDSRKKDRSQKAKREENVEAIRQNVCISRANRAANESLCELEHIPKKQQAAL